MSKPGVIENPLEARIAATRSRRLRQVLHVILATMMALFLLNLLMSDIGTQLVMLSSIAVLSFAYLPLRRHNTSLAALIIVIVMALCLAAVMWLGSGVRSSAMFAYPGLLIFCVLMGERRLFLLCYACLLLYMTALVAATHAGLRTGSEHFTSWLVLLEFIVVMTAITFVVYALAGDIFKLMGSLEADRRQALISGKAERHLALHDTLTGLPNRRQAAPLFAALRERSSNRGLGVAVAFIDLDNFKMINDDYGHPVGDQVLKLLARRLKASIRQDDALLRLGGDEFLLLLADIHSRAEVSDRLDCLLAALQEPIVVADVQIRPALTVGVALASVGETGLGIDSLIERADRAMYHGKREGRNQYRFHDAERLLAAD